MPTTILHINALKARTRNIYLLARYLDDRGSEE